MSAHYGGSIEYKWAALPHFRTHNFGEASLKSKRCEDHLGRRLIISEEKREEERGLWYHLDMFWVYFRTHMRRRKRMLVAERAERNYNPLRSLN